MRRSRIVGTSATFSVLLLLAIGVPRTPPAVAGDLKNAVKDLYGGNGITLEPTPPPFPSHDPHFTTSSLAGLDTLGRSIAASINTLGFNSAVTGFTLDVERGVPVRTTEGLGPLLAERALTLGAGKLNIGFSYTRIDFKTFRGTRLDKLSLTLSHQDVNNDNELGSPEFELDQVRVDLDLDIRQEIFALYGTYGITRVWDIGVIVPIVHVTFRAKAEATIIRNSAVSALAHNFGPRSDSPTSRAGGEDTGIGDVIVRSKYNFLRNQGEWPDLAVVGQVTLPTGDADNLLGTGETEFLGMLVASKTLGIFDPHVNVGYELSTAGSQENNVRYVAGVDARLHPRFSMSADVLGRWKPDGDGTADHVADVAVGGRWNVFRALNLNAYVQVPLNREVGLRPTVIWSIGADYTF
jgi:Putative MetA-pathway of phenol degradation